MNENTTYKSYRIDTGLILTLVLIVAKVWGNAPISWLFCFAPLLIVWGISFVLVFILIWLNRNYLL